MKDLYAYIYLMAALYILSALFYTFYNPNIITLTFVTVSFIVGFLLLSLGIIAHYLHKIYESINEDDEEEL